MGSEDHKDLEAKGQLFHVGARFEAHIEGVVMAPLDFRYTQVGFNLTCCVYGTHKC